MPSCYMWIDYTGMMGEIMFFKEDVAGEKIKIQKNADDFSVSLNLTK